MMCVLDYSVVFIGVRCVFFFQAEDGIRDLVRSRGLGDVYKRQIQKSFKATTAEIIFDDSEAFKRCESLKTVIANKREEFLSLIHI